MTQKTGPTTPPLLDAKTLHIPAIDMHPAVRVNLQLHSGELTLLHCADTPRASAIADALLGLGAHTGTVYYRQQLWSSLSEQQARLARREVGRVQSHGNWIESVSVMDNILLPLMHHTIVPEDILRAAASDMARRFGLPGLPKNLPADCPPADLERCACIRAFLGRPQLAILEYPQRLTRNHSALISCIGQVRRRKGAVLWITDDNNKLADRAIPADRRYRLLGSQLIQLETDHANA